MKRLYALLHVKPGERAQAILFAEDPPKGSRPYALRELAKATTPADQARAIVDNQIPYRVAATVVKQMTPTVLLALVSSMSAQELINNLASLKKRGALDNAEIKALVDEKLEAAKSGPRVSALKTGKAVEAAVMPEDIKAKLEAVADTQIKAKGRIKRLTALLIDKSGSMSAAIELGKRIGSMISAVCEKELYVYAFDSMAYPIERAGDDLASWERALLGITAGGNTSCGVGVEHMRLKGQIVEQIILVTDEGENTGPLFVPTLQKYRESLKADPGVCIVRTPGAVRRPGKAVPCGRHCCGRVPVQRRLLLAAESGASPEQAQPAGTAHGDHGVPAAGAEERMTMAGSGFRDQGSGLRNPPEPDPCSLALSMVQRLDLCAMIIA